MCSAVSSAVGRLAGEHGITAVPTFILLKPEAGNWTEAGRVSGASIEQVHHCVSYIHRPREQQTSPVHKEDYISGCSETRAAEMRAITPVRHSASAYRLTVVRTGGYHGRTVCNGLTLYRIPRSQVRTVLNKL